MLRFVYTLLVALALPFASVSVWWRGLRDRDYWVGGSERFGYGSRLDAHSIWVHAASVGEVRVAASLVAALHERWPNCSVVVTSTTPAGRATAAAATSALGTYASARFAPYDLPGFVRRALRRLRPVLLVIVETELWPNLLNECTRADVPILMASARVSARTAARLARFPTLLRPALVANVTVAAQSAQHAQRFEDLGVPRARLHVCGSIKFDRTASEVVRVSGAAHRKHYADARPLWVAGSTHAGEEEAALAAHAMLCNQHAGALLVLAPRHRPRFAEVAQTLERSGVRWARRSAQTSGAQIVTGRAAADCSVLLLDTIGELESFYAAADVAFVGGSLVPVGGHNLLEPAALGVATLTGPYQDNAPEVARRLIDAGAVRVVSSAAELGAALSEWVADPGARQRLVSAAAKIIGANQGALGQTLDLATELLAPRVPGPPASR